MLEADSGGIASKNMNTVTEDALKHARIQAAASRQRLTSILEELQNVERRLHSIDCLDKFKRHYSPSAFNFLAAPMLTVTFSPLAGTVLLMAVFCPDVGLLAWSESNSA